MGLQTVTFEMVWFLLSSNVATLYCVSVEFLDDNIREMQH